MIVGMIATDGGPHPAAKWAEITVEQIVQVEENASEAAMALRGNIKIALAEEFERVQSSERSAIERDVLRVGTLIDPSQFLEAALAKVISTASGTKYESAISEGREHIKRVLGRSFATAIDIERDWYARRNSDEPICKAYRRAREAHGAPFIHAHINSYLPETAPQKRAQQGL